MSVIHRGRWWVSVFGLTVFGGSWVHAASRPLAAEPVSESAQAPDPAASPAAVVRRAEDVVVQAIRADAEVPVTKTDLGRDAIERLNYGQEMPVLLQTTPSLTSYADAGGGAGYAYFYIRGIQQTRINMTFDGAPLNDPEESALYFSNFGDFASALGSIQVQRGVGVSTVGAASYGGSVNFASVDPRSERGLGAEVGAGAYGSRRGALTLDSGRLPGGLLVYGRASYQETDGFRDHSGVRQRALYFGVSRMSDRSVFKLSGFSGLEHTQLAFLAVEKDVLERDLTNNPLSPEERDRFGQDLVQAQYTRFVGRNSSIALQAYYNGAQGWFRLWDDAAARTALLQYGIDGHFVGSVLTFNHARGPVHVTAGAHVGDFTREHFLDVVGGDRTYVNTGTKAEADAFLKFGYDRGPWTFYADAQLRWARFRYTGALDLGAVSWSFFNPKLGVRRALAGGLSSYVSLGRVKREPTRSDLLAGEDNATLPYDLQAVKPERAFDVEAGVQWKRGGVSVVLDAYAMEFRDEIALTGELSAIGLPLRRNVDRSHRRGIELDVDYQVLPRLRLRGNANWSRNRIHEWTQFYDVYDPDGTWVDSVSRIHSDVPPVYTPALTTNGGVEWTPAARTSLGLNGRYVSAAQLDNTGNRNFRTPSFFVLDATASLDLSSWAVKGQPRLRAQFNNLLDNQRIWPNGYSYLYFNRDARGEETLAGTPYYYPQARRSLFVALDVRF